jgi:hypothetical protein
MRFMPSLCHFVGSVVWGVRSEGYAYLHDAVDDHSRLAYSEIFDDERKDTAADFWRRANVFFSEHGNVVKRVLTDNGNCYRSRTFADALGSQIHHKRTRMWPVVGRTTSRTSGAS